jgi:hypothetical protein
VLNSLERIAAKLLKLVEGCPTATAPRQVYAPERASVILSVVKLGEAMDGQRAGVRAAGEVRALLLTRHQQALLRAVVHALHSKGIECHEKMWQVAAKRIGVNPLRRALERSSKAEREASRAQPPWP